MHKTPRLTQGLASVLLTLLLGGGCLTVWAQPDQQEPIEPAPPEQRETQDAENIPATIPEETDADDYSPFDYQPSEQISEDLSVSFPVDI